MAEAVKVIVRCRPLNARENSLNCATVVAMDESVGQVALSKPNAEAKTEPPKTFSFDGVFFVKSTTQQIYGDIAFPLVDGVLEGYNGTVFAYGQTGCGKSFTMTGIEDPPEQRGIIPRAFRHIFDAIASSDDAKFLVHGSFLEIYNEEIRDLLGKDVKQRLELKEHPERGVYVKDLTKIPVHNAPEIERIMELGSKNRSVGATLMNADSSRSHSIFTISLERCSADASAGAEGGGSGLRAGKLNLVDLAGSERQAKTGATGDRLKEATKINLSLSALGNVISALVDGKSKHIPYRDSKLTRLLQDSLGGNTKTLMVACISPADNNYDETLSTLRYANRAKNIKNKPKINEDPKDALLREYAEEIARLKAMLSGQLPPTTTGSVQAKAPTESQEALRAAKEEAERAKQEAEELRQQYEKQVEEVQKLLETAQQNESQVQKELLSVREEYERKLGDVESRMQTAEQVVAKEEEAVMKGQPAAQQTHRVWHASLPGKGQPGHEVVPPMQPQGSMLADSLQEPGRQAANLLNGPSLISAPQKIAEVSTAGNATSIGATIATPSASTLQPEQALQRLQQLEHQLVGGERTHDQALKKKLAARRKHADRRRELLVSAVEQADDDGIMESIYDSLQDEIKAKNKQLVKTQEKLKSVTSDISDIEHEFERDRQDYLDTIRQQERQLALQQQIIDTILPCLRRDCNYTNIDWVRSSAVWNEDGGKWTLPQLKIIKTSLPSTSSVPSNSPEHNGPVRPSMYDGIDDNDRLRQRLQRSGESDYFKSKRQQQLLAEAKSLKAPKSTSLSGSNKRLDKLPHPSQLPPSITGSVSQSKPMPSVPLKPIIHPTINTVPPPLELPDSFEKNLDKYKVRHRSLQPLNDKRLPQ